MNYASRELLPIYDQVDFFHFLNLGDHNRVRPCPLKYGPASPHVFADKWHELLPLIRVFWRRWGNTGDHPWSE
jgi:hypothetical protein